MERLIMAAVQPGAMRGAARSRHTVRASVRVALRGEFRARLTRTTASLKGFRSSLACWRSGRVATSRSAERSPRVYGCAGPGRRLRLRTRSRVATLSWRINTPAG